MQTRRTRYDSRDPQPLSRRGLSTLLASLGLIFFHATTTLADDMMVTTVWTHYQDPGLTVETEAFFDPANLSDVGVVPPKTAVQVVEFRGRYGDRSQGDGAPPRDPGRV